MTLLPRLKQRLKEMEIGYPEHFSTRCEYKLIKECIENINAKQAWIDTLMLEYCPTEMTQHQRKEWADNQKRVEDKP